jgi:hypothetical protein
MAKTIFANLWIRERSPEHCHCPRNQFMHAWKPHPCPQDE